MKAAVVIPARYASSRFPGKAVLRDPDGKPLIQYVVEAARKAVSVDCVLVATDDARIREVVLSFGGDVRMTSPRCTCGSERSAEIAAALPHEIVINLQADEPGVHPEMLDQTVDLLRTDAEAVVATLARPITSEKDLRDPNIVKVVRDAAGRALYFSRSPIPYVRDARDPVRESPVAPLHHLGLYAYRRAFLLRYPDLGPHPLEEAEKLEQLRVLAHGYKIAVGVTERPTFKVDTPEDFERFTQEYHRARRGD